MSPPRRSTPVSARQGRQDGARRPAESLDDANVAATFVRAVTAGEEWFPALLHAIADWRGAEEEWHERRYRYLIAGEAFDWLLLAERLLSEVNGAVPEPERARLLFHGEPPTPLDAASLRGSIGSLKYRAQVNYWYGVILEEALQQAVLEEVAKAHLGQPSREGRKEEESFQLLYGDTPGSLLVEFRQAAGLPLSASSSLEEQREFTYWLFKRRLARSEPALLASDTRKALLSLARLSPGSWRWVQGEEPEPPSIGLSQDP